MRPSFSQFSTAAAPGANRSLCLTVLEGNGLTACIVGDVFVRFEFAVTSTAPRLALGSQAFGCGGCERWQCARARWRGWSGSMYWVPKLSVCVRCECV